PSRQLAHGVSLLTLPTLGHRVLALVDPAPELLGLLPGCRDAPFRILPDRVAPLRTVEAVVHDEREDTAGCDAHAEALDGIVVGDRVALLGRRQPLHQPVGDNRPRTSRRFP